MVRALHRVVGARVWVGAQSSGRLPIGGWLQVTSKGLC